MRCEPLSLDTVLERIRLAAGLAALTLGDDGCCQFIVDDSFAVNVGHNQASGAIVFFSVVGDFPENGGDLALALLQANCFWEGTGGATLSVDADGRQVLLALQTVFSAETVDELPAVLSNFIVLTENWILKIREFLRASAIPPSGAGFAPGAVIMKA